MRKRGNHMLGSSHRQRKLYGKDKVRKKTFRAEGDRVRHFGIRDKAYDRKARGY